MYNKWAELTTLIMRCKYAGKNPMFPPEHLFGYQNLSRKHQLQHFCWPSSCVIVSSFTRWKFLLSPEKCGKEHEGWTCDNAGFTPDKVCRKKDPKRIFGLSHSFSTSPVFKQMCLAFSLGSYFILLPSSFFPSSLLSLPLLLLLFLSQSIWYRRGFLY